MTTSTNKKLFLSAVSSEFESYRRLLADDLKRPTLDVAVQEDFVVSGGSTLEKRCRPCPPGAWSDPREGIWFATLYCLCRGGPSGPPRPLRIRTQV